MVATDELLSAQVLFGLRVRDAVSGSEPRTPVHATLALTPGGRPVSGLIGPMLQDGRIGWAGEPSTTLAALADGPVAVRVSATAAGYGDAHVDVALAPGDGAPQPRTLAEVAGPLEVVEWEWDDSLDPHPLRLELELSPQAVGLRGQVHESASPFGPIEGATVHLATGPGANALTGADGRYAFAALPLASAVVLEVSHPDHDSATVAVAVDYARPVNVADVALNAH